MNYRKRPLEVDAVRLTREFLASDGCFDWVASAFDTRHGKVGSIRVIQEPSALQVDFIVVTPHGPVNCRFGDWVVRDNFGHLHPYTDEDFQLIFEEVE